MFSPTEASSTQRLSDSGVFLTELIEVREVCRSLELFFESFVITLMRLLVGRFTVFSTFVVVVSLTVDLCVPEPCTVSHDRAINAVGVGITSPLFHSFIYLRALHCTVPVHTLVCSAVSCLLGVSHILVMQTNLQCALC